MFYPVHLLSRRRRGKLAPSWLAAIFNEKSFKSYYNVRAIKKMNVVQTCEKILQVLQSRNRSNDFSLYLSSQLMYGTMKIHSYQTALFQKEAFKFEQNLKCTASLKEKEDDCDAIEDFEFPAIELSLLSQNFRDAQLVPDLQILPGEDTDNMLQIDMQDAASLNFGCLNDKEWERLFKRDHILLDMEKKLRMKQKKDISEMMADMTITEEVHQEQQPFQETLNPVFTSKRKDWTKQKLSLTSKKRQLHQVGAPTKRKRLSFKTALMTVSPASVDNVAVSAELPAEEMRMLIPSQQTESDMEIESLCSSCFVNHLKKSKVIDQKIALTSNQRMKWHRQDVNICYRKLKKPISLKHRQIPAIDLFKQPSHLPMRWHARLRDNFVYHITGPFMSVDEDVAPAELTQLQETFSPRIRVRTISRINLLTEDLSTFAKTDITIAKSADSVMNILPMINIVHEIADVSVPPLPEVTPDTIILEEGISIVEHGRDQKETPNLSNNDSSKDIEILLERQQCSLETIDILDSSDTSSETSPPTFKREIWAMLNVLWHDTPCVKFSRLIPKDAYTREDAATAFNILLELHSEKSSFCSRLRVIVLYRFGSTRKVKLNDITNVIETSIIFTKYSYIIYFLCAMLQIVLFLL